jgi:hypothetical protein
MTAKAEAYVRRMGGCRATSWPGCGRRSRSAVRGGAVITNAALGEAHVKAPIYVDAFIPDQG